MGNVVELCNQRVPLLRTRIPMDALKLWGKVSHNDNSRMIGSNEYGTDKEFEMLHPGLATKHSIRNCCQ